MPDYFDLGSHTRPVTTGSDLAQTWFNRGLLWAYGFNHEEAAACFERATTADPDCVMAYWGHAYALGPNYNKPWEAFGPDEAFSSISWAATALAMAEDRADRAAPVEGALVRALSLRYPTAGSPLIRELSAAELAERGAEWNSWYADGMREVYRLYPEDLDVAALLADALLNLTPWALWDRVTGEQAPDAAAAEAKDVLERALASPGGEAHPGVLHMYIHLMEMSARPEDALRAGDLLRDLVPDAGHLRHMPTHLDVLCGDYRNVVSANTAAIAADEKFLAQRGAMNTYTLYRAHDYHFKIYGAMFLGHARTALDAADQLAAAIPEDLLRVESPPMADWLEGFVAMKLHVLIRFGRWRDILAVPLPGDQELYRMTTAMTRYARGIACAATGQLGEAAEQRDRFAEAAERVPESRTIFNNTCRDILAVAGAMLDGELEYRRGNYDEAFARLRRAVELDDGLPYDEPWGWMQPARHAYGALLLEQGRVTEAEAVYRADLGLDDTLARSSQHPGNVWSLHGYHECLTRLGKREQADIVNQQLKIAAAYADVPIESSCYCRGAAAAGANLDEGSAPGAGMIAGRPGLAPP